MCTSLSVGRRDPLEIGGRQSAWGHRWARTKFIGTNGVIFQRSRVLSGKRAGTRNDCLMDFKDHITDATASLASAGRICVRSTAVKFGIPFGPVLKHGPRSLSNVRVNG